MADEKKKEHKKNISLKYRKSENGVNKIKTNKKEYNKRPEVVHRKRQYHHIRKVSDVEYVIKRRLRFRLRSLVVAMGNNKYWTKRTMELVGCSATFLKEHLENQFTDGMSWERLTEIEIDHIKPCAKFDLTNPEQQALCFSWKNLQPLWAIDNRIKSAKYEE